MTDCPPALSRWLADALGEQGPFTLTRLSGGNSNETLALASPRGSWILRRPPHEALDPSAHNMMREYRVMSAVEGAGVPAPRAVAICEDPPPEVAPSPFMVMEHIDGVALTDTLPASYPGIAGIGEAVIDALVALQAVSWQDRGLGDFGRPQGFLGRQVSRWSRQLQNYQGRELPYHSEVAAWLEDNQPSDTPPAIMHGDFHLDNCLLAPTPPPAVAAIIDWEMSTIGDPMLDVGLFLAFWGDERPERPAMARVQAVTRGAGAPPRRALAERYAERSGRSVEHLNWYMALGFWKLATIVESAYAQFLVGELLTDYARALEYDVPALLTEAAGFAGIS